MPLTINYVNADRYGIWLTISSIVVWFSFFDIGLYPKIRNKFAGAKARGDDESTQVYVSTTYSVWGDYWRFTTLSMEKSFEDVFGKGNVQVAFYGNVLSSIAFLEGICAEELKASELFFKDPNYQMTIVIKAIKRTH